MAPGSPYAVTYLDLWNCGLGGTVPWELLLGGQFSQLQVLKLAQNPDLTGTALMPDDDGPAAAAGLPQLRYLGLAGDPALSGTVPSASLAGLAQLRELYLQSTQVDAAQCRGFCDAHAATVSDGCNCP